MPAGDPPPDPALNATLPASAFAPDPAREHLARTMALSDQKIESTGPRLSQRSLAADLVVAGRHERNEPRDRFAIEGMLGHGATGEVYAVRDRNLDRTVAVKILGQAVASEDVDRFIDEARITASLQHPNVLPLYEIAVNEHGEVYFLMKRVEGCSLGESISTSTSGQRSDRIASHNAVVSIFIAIANALACAHRANVVHQDIKPDNIMLGEFGETLLVDWGSAVRDRARDTNLYGTPLYMSPEQARRDYADARSDIYCLGATLFHTLLLRPPTWSDDPEAFWTRKKTGDLDAITDAERARVPMALLAIAIKAMAADPAARYQSARELILDLERYQAGLAISAHRDSWREALARWHRRHWRALWSTAAAAAVIIALGGSLYGERLKEISSWGRPISSEDFADDSWAERWQITEGAGHVQDGRFITTSDGETLLTYRTPVRGDLAIEFEGEMLPGCYPCDLSVQINPENAADAGNLTAALARPSYHFQVGAHGGSFCRIMDPTNSLYSFNSWRPEIGHRYRIRVETVGNHLSLQVDGRTLCSYSDIYPFAGGYVSIYLYYPKKAIDHLRLFVRALPQKMPGMAIGDFCAQSDLHERAVDQYDRVAGGGGPTAITQEAWFKKGLSQYRLQRIDAAFQTWAAIHTQPWQSLVELHRIDRSFTTADHPDVLARLAGLYAASDPDIRKKIVAQFGRHLGVLTQLMLVHGDGTLLTSYVEAHHTALADDRLADLPVASAMIMLGRFDDVIRRFPDYPVPVADGLSAQGRYLEILQRFPDMPTISMDALEKMGRMAEIPQRFPDVGKEYWYAMIGEGKLERLNEIRPRHPLLLYLMGRLDEAAALTPTHTPALLALGRAAEVAENLRDDLAYMMYQGRFQECSDRWGRHLFYGSYARAGLGMDRWLAGDHAGAEPLLATDPVREFRDAIPPILRYLIIPFLHELDGDRDAFPRLRRQFEDPDRRWVIWQKPWYYLAYISGEITDEQLLAQPHRLFAEADLRLCRAIGHDRAGRAAEAAQDYRAYLAIPEWKRGFGPEAISERFLAWRIRQLAP
ncbi:MAG: serine/threonine protein kinase [Planctomycetes bacterium]|nr:serine/threonine protein kinase [Planctomycetota bacterium]